MKEFLTWEEFEAGVDILVEKIKAWDYSPDFIYGIPRGGLILATMLSHRLGIPLSTKLDDYGDSGANYHAQPASYIICDDIVDKGHTLMKVLRGTHYPYGVGIRAVSLHYCDHSYIKPTEYAWKKDDDKWIVYPWETEESEKDEIADYELGQI